MPAPTITDLLKSATGDLRELSSTPRLDAELLLAYALGWPRARLLAERGHSPAAEQAATFAALLGRRALGEPVAYLLGLKEFYGLDLLVTPATLIPRPETEQLVELAIAEAGRLTTGDRRPPAAFPQPALTIADVGTGTGAVAIALAAQLQGAVVYATDLSAEALAVARRNVEGHGLAGRVHLLHGDLLAPLPAPVDIIVSNPPYTILAEVEPAVRAYEPRLALDGGPDGAAVYRRLLAAAPAYVRPGGAVLLEIGAWQGELVACLLREAFPAASISVQRDLSGHDRVAMARQPLPPV